MDEDLVVRARIDDELSRPLENIGDELDRVGREADTAGGRAARSSRGWSTLGRVGRNALLGITAAAAGASYAAFRLGKSALTQASDLNESLNAVTVTYGRQARAVKRLGREAAQSVGMSNTEFNGLAVQFAAFAKTVGKGGKGTVRTLDDLTTRAADFASVMNLDVAEAAALFQSGLAGETEPLRRYGIDLSAAAVSAHAVAVGIADSASEMTEAEKVQARYSLLMRQTAQTQGDFANTSGDLANQQRILAARFDNAQAKLGRGLLPIATQVVQYLNREGIPAFLKFSDWFTEKGMPAIGEFSDEYLPKLKSLLGDVGDVIGPVASAARDLVDAFLDMPGWAKKALIGGGLAAGGAAKLGLIGSRNGAGGGGSGLMGLATKARPLPVFVVNNVPGGPGSGTPGVVGGPDGKPKPGAPTTPKPKPGIGGRIGGALKGIGGALSWLGGPLTMATVASSFGTIPGPSSDQIITDAEEARRVLRDVEAQQLKVTELGASGAKALENLFGVTLDGAGRTQLEVARVTRNAEDLASLIVDPLFKTPGLPEADRKGREYKGLLEILGRPVNTDVNINTGPAQARVAELVAAARSAANTIASLFTFDRAPAAPNNSNAFNDLYDVPRRERGGPVTAGRPYIVGERRAELYVPRTGAARVVGERRAELFVPDRSGTIVPRLPRQEGRGAVTVEAGAIVINVDNPSSDVDVRRAVRQALDEVERDRRERGA